MPIDRTKIRVLYVEGSSQPMHAVRVGDRYQYRGPFSDLKQALTEDEDIECVVLVGAGRRRPADADRRVRPGRRRPRLSDDGGRAGRRSTRSSSATWRPRSFTEKQLEWIEQWIGQRGGGLCMVGGEHSFASGGWDQTPLAAMLPVEMLPGGADWVPGETIRIAPELPPSPHPLWNLVADEKQNRQIVGDFPGRSLGVNRWAGARPNLTTVLATTRVAGTARGRRPGRGRCRSSLGNICKVVQG